MQRKRAPPWPYAVAWLPLLRRRRALRRATADGSSGENDLQRFAVSARPVAPSSGVTTGTAEAVKTRRYPPTPPTRHAIGIGVRVRYAALLLNTGYIGQLDGWRLQKLPLRGAIGMGAADGTPAAPRKPLTDVLTWSAGSRVLIKTRLLAY